MDYFIFTKHSERFEAYLFNSFLELIKNIYEKII